MNQHTSLLEKQLKSGMPIRIGELFLINFLLYYDRIK